jgi:hypothetical protein
VVSNVGLSVAIYCSKVMCSTAFLSGKFSGEYCKWSEPGHSVHSLEKKTRLTIAHHHCQAVMVKRELSILICHQFSQFVSFKHQFDIWWAVHSQTLWVPLALFSIQFSVWLVIHQHSESFCLMTAQLFLCSICLFRCHYQLSWLQIYVSYICLKRTFWKLLSKPCMSFVACTEQ